MNKMQMLKMLLPKIPKDGEKYSMCDKAMKLVRTREAQKIQKNEQAEADNLLSRL